MVIHSIASAQPRVVTLHLIVHELLGIFSRPVAVEVPALRSEGARVHKNQWFLD
jgi:hypothetical protein